MISLDHPAILLAAMFVVSLAPFCLLGVTSFIKMSVVFAILRNALGAQQVPSGMVISALALVLSLYVMEPTAQKMYQATSDAWSESISTKAQNSGKRSQIAIEPIWRTAEKGIQPLVDFLRQHSHEKEQKVFFDLRQKMRAQPEMPIATGADNQTSFDPSISPIAVLIPAFVISELQEAFSIGVVIFLPFLVVDLIVANILMGLGMVMVSPVSISLPFKLLLFVLCDGWTLLCQGLVLGYA